MAHRDSNTTAGTGLIGGTLWFGIVSLLVILFWFEGNAIGVEVYGRSAFRWMVGLWRYEHYDFSYGWFVPLVSLFFLWRKRDQLQEAPRQTCWWGILVVVAALIAHVAGIRAQQTRLSLLAFIGLLWGIPLLTLGWRVARITLFPCIYLAFCVPLTFLDGLTFKLRVIAAVTSALILNGIGMSTLRSGTMLQSLVGEGFMLDVADACSGLRYFLAMTALAAAYAYLTQPGIVKKWLLFLSAIPIAIAANVARVMGIAIVAGFFGQELATGVYHDYSGYIVFSVAIGLLLAAAGLINIDYSERMRRWRDQIQSRATSRH